MTRTEEDSPFLPRCSDVVGCKVLLQSLDVGLSVLCGTVEFGDRSISMVVVDPCRQCNNLMFFLMFNSIPYRGALIHKTEQMTY